METTAYRSIVLIKNAKFFGNMTAKVMLLVVLFFTITGYMFKIIERPPLGGLRL